MTDHPWSSTVLLVADLAGDGTVIRANATLERFAGRALPGTRFEELVTPAQRGALAERLRDAGDVWQHACFALEGVPGGPAVDRELWLRRTAGVVTLIGEPAVGEQERLVAKVLELNDELIQTHRELVGQREALREAAERIRHLEAISAAGLMHLRLDDVLADVLTAIATAVGAERAVIVLPDGRVVAHGRPAPGGGSTSVPLVLDGEVIGALEVAAHDPDMGLLERAAERAAVAISRAQAHERERRIAETLQRALLPDRLPSVAGLTLAARFEPAAGGVGGDWYDALPLPSGLVAIAIGDVAGKGVRAAAVMGEIRSGLRAYALDGGHPHEVLERLNVLVERSAQMATVLLVLVDPAGGEVRYASAGHLPPLLLAPGGDATLLDAGRGAPLLAYRPSAGSGVATLDRGAQLVLYTDGLVERRGEPIDAGLARLVGAARAGADGADEMCEAIVGALRAPEAADDVAVLAVQRC